MVILGYIARTPHFFEAPQLVFIVKGPKQEPVNFYAALYLPTEGLFFWVFFFFFFFGPFFFFWSIFLVFPKKTTIPSIFLKDLMHFRGFWYEKQ